MVDFDFMRSCLKEKIQAKVVSSENPSRWYSEKIVKSEKKIVFLNYAKPLKQEGVKLFLWQILFSDPIFIWTSHLVT